MSTAVLVDARAFLASYAAVFPGKTLDTPEQVAADLLALVQQRTGDGEAVAVSVYDSPVPSRTVETPVSKTALDLSHTEKNQFRAAFQQALAGLEAVTLRLSAENASGAWQLKPRALVQVAKGSLTAEELDDDDFVYRVPPLGVELLMGLDLAGLFQQGAGKQVVVITDDATALAPAVPLAQAAGVVLTVVSLT